MKYRVFDYSPDTFYSLLSEDYGSSKTNIARVKSKIHAKFFKNYFGTNGVNAKTIVVEKDYTDKDFLIDYASYYVRCFEDYARTCTRLHFFSEDVSRRTFRSILLREVSDERIDRFRSSYLGFIVVRPLQDTIIGRTCLTPYPAESTFRFFPTSRKYEVNLHGLSLHVETLAFQEQDHVVAACATSALWTVFQGTAKLFQHRIPSPAEITKLAIENSALSTRGFPNKGLEVHQMARAIKQVGLEPVSVSSSMASYDLDVIKTNIAAYARAGIPLLLLVPLVKQAEKDKWVIFDLHAVTVTGFHCEPDSQNVDTGNISHFMDKIYVHDDQVGPHARMNFKGLIEVVTENNLTESLPSMTTSHGTVSGLNEIRAIPNTLLIPLYHKIRIPCEEIHTKVEGFVALIDSLFKPGVERIMWDIQLTNVNSLKKSIHQDKRLASKHKSEVLLKPLPLFLWRIRFSSHSLPLLDILYDATGISQGKLFLESVIYDSDFGDMLRAILGVPAINKHLCSTPSEPIVKSLIQ